MRAILTIVFAWYILKECESQPAGQSCPAEVSCQNGGQLKCTYSCVGDSIQASLECLCECTGRFFGALCESQKPCSDGDDGETTTRSGTAAITTTAATTSTATTTAGTTTISATTTIAATTNFNLSEVPMPYLIAAAGVDLIVVNPNNGSHYTLPLQLHEHALIYSVAVDWIKGRIFGSGTLPYHQIFTMLISEPGNLTIVYTRNETLHETSIFAVAVDPIRDFIFFTQSTKAYGDPPYPERYISRINYDGTNQMAVSGQLRNWASGIAVDPSIHTIYFQIYAFDSIDGVYMCDYLNSGDCSQIHRNREIRRPLDVILDPQSGQLFWSGVDDSLEWNLFYCYDVSSGTRTFLGNYTTNSLDIVLGGLAVRGNYLYMMDSGYHGHWSSAQCDDTQLPLFRMPVSGGTVEEFSDYIFESCLNGNPLA